MPAKASPHAGRAAPGRLVSVPLVLLVLVMAQGCAAGGGARRAGGSTLSQAATEAKQGPEEKHKVLQAGDPFQEKAEGDGWATDVFFAMITAPGPSDDERAPEPDAQLKQAHLGVVGGYGLPTSNVLGGYGLGGLQMGFQSAGRARLDVAFLGTGARFTQTSGLTQSFKHPYQLAVDLSGRYYLTDEHSPIGVYPLAGFQVGWLFWDYAHPILVDDYGTRSVGSDVVSYGSPYVGLGASLIQTPNLHFGVQLIGGMRFYDGHSAEGLANDLFEDGGFWQIRLELTKPF